MKFSTFLAIIILACLSIVCTGAALLFTSAAHAAEAPVELVDVTGTCVPEKFNLPAGVSVSYQIAGPAEFKPETSRCMRIEQPGMKRQIMAFGNCTDFTKYDVAEEKIREKDRVAGDVPSFDYKETGCYTSAAAGEHLFYLPRYGMKGFSLIVHFRLQSPNGRSQDVYFNRLLHAQDLKADPMQKIAVCTPVHGDLNQCEER